MSELRTILKNQTEGKKEIFLDIGKKISKARKSSRKKLDGIAKKLNISVDILTKIENGEITNLPPTIHVTGFLRAFSEKVNCDITDELEQLLEKKAYKKNLNPSKQKINPKLNFFLIVITVILLVTILYFLISKEKLGNNELAEFSLKDRVSNSEGPTKKKINNEFLEVNNDYTYKNHYDDEKLKEESKESQFIEITFLEETWIEIFDKEKILLDKGLFKIGQSLNFSFKEENSDFFIKSGNLGGFQIFYNNEFFAPFGLSGQVSNGFFVKKKIESIYDIKAMRNEY